jgi:transposase-like protein
VQAALGTWRAGIPGSGHQTQQEEEIRHLKRENELLRQERDILKKAIGIFSRTKGDEISVHC